MSLKSPPWRKILIGSAAVILAAAAVTYTGSSTNAYADVQVVTDAKTAADGKQYWVQNHLVSQDLAKIQAESGGQRKEWLLVWAGDENIADTAVKDVKNLPGTISGGLNKVKNALPGPDFLAVIDATKGSSTYGKVVNTATVGPLVENEPHHMQYVWHKGDTVYAGALFAAATYAFDVSALPQLKLKGISLPTQTLGGSVPDAYWTLKDGTSYGTYMGGPVVPGPYTYANGQTVIGNGFAGSPGELVHFGQNGEVLSQTSAATPQGDNATLCENLPTLGQATCANPHGIQAREDLNTLVTSDYAEPRNIILDPVKQPSPYLRRPTVRTWDITDRDHPKVKAVSYLPVGPRATDYDPLYREDSAIMETTVTNQPGHKGAFAQSMQGGAVFYTPDITAAEPHWYEVFDDGAANKGFSQKNDNIGASSNGGWIQTSPDDKYLYRAITGRQKGALGADDPGTAGGVYVLDIQKLLAAGPSWAGPGITTKEQAQNGGGGVLPTVAGAAGINPDTPGAGPHWGAYDNFVVGQDGFYHETDEPTRIAASNYFVARSGLDGDHKVNLLDLSPDGQIAVDQDFRDEFTHQVGINFNRKSWPHGDFGNAKPHSELFVVSDADVK